MVVYRDKSGFVGHIYIYIYIYTLNGEVSNGRACKRCCPGGDGGTLGSRPRDGAVRRTVIHIECSIQ